MIDMQSISNEFRLAYDFCDRYKLSANEISFQKAMKELESIDRNSLSFALILPTLREMECQVWGRYDAWNKPANRFKPYDDRKK